MSVPWWNRNIFKKKWEKGDQQVRAQKDLLIVEWGKRVSNPRLQTPVMI